MSGKYGKHSKGNKKRKAEDQYDLQTILDDDASNDGGEAVEPRAAARNAETNDESVRISQCFGNRRIIKSKHIFRRRLKTSTALKIIVRSWN